MEIDRHFLTEARLAFPISFTEAQEQNEKWFTRRQLPDLFTSLREQGHLSHWEREVLLERLLPQISEGKPSREKIDFVVTLDQQPIPLEVKTLYLGRQGNSDVGISVYFDKNPASGYIAADVHKLAKIGHGYCVLFVHPFPNPQLWSANVKRFAQKMASQGIEVNEIGILDLKQYSPHLYIAKLEVSYMEG
jgi:hypothetical protein